MLGILKKSFEITEGSPSSFAGMQIQRSRQEDDLCPQRRYIERILTRFGMIDARRVCTRGPTFYCDIDQQK